MSFGISNRRKQRCQMTEKDGKVTLHNEGGMK